MTLKIKRGPAGDPPSGTPEPVPAPSSGPTPRVRPLVAPRAPSSAKNRAKVLLSILAGKIECEKMTAESRKQFEKPRPTPPTHIAPAHINAPLVVVSPANRPAPIIEVPFSMPSNGEPEGFTALEDLQ